MAWFVIPAIIFGLLAFLCLLYGVTEEQPEFVFLGILAAALIASMCYGVMQMNFDAEVGALAGKARIEMRENDRGEKVWVRKPTTQP